jgi:hypothetical protein
MQIRALFVVSRLVQLIIRVADTDSDKTSSIGVSFMPNGCETRERWSVEGVWRGKRAIFRPICYHCAFDIISI